MFIVKVNIAETSLNPSIIKSQSMDRWCAKLIVSIRMSYNVLYMLCKSETDMLEKIRSTEEDNLWAAARISGGKRWQNNLIYQACQFVVAKPSEIPFNLINTKTIFETHIDTDLIWERVQYPCC